MIRTHRVLYLLLTGLVLALSAGTPTVTAKKVTTKLKAPTTNTGANRERTTRRFEGAFESVVSKLTFMAYDKKAGASKETFFVDNGSKQSLESLEIEIRYFNEAGKQIHRRTVTITQEFPAEDTCKVDIDTWDKQHSFHYVNSVPSAKGSTPYTVKFKVISFK